MFKFLNEDTKSSTIRVVLFMGTVAAFLLMLGMLYHIISYEEVKWESMSVFLLAVSSYLGTLLFGKVSQKKIENKDSKQN